MEFSPSANSPILPVWIAFPGLPINFFIEPLLRSIAGNVERVLKIDPFTLNLSNAMVARVCVELDVSKHLPSRVWIGCPGGGAWQEIQYPDILAFCSVCSRLGHSKEDCKGKRILNSTNKVQLSAPIRNPPKPKSLWQHVATKKDEVLTSNSPLNALDVSSESGKNPPIVVHLDEFRMAYQEKQNYDLPQGDSSVAVNDGRLPNASHVGPVISLTHNSTSCEFGGARTFNSVRSTDNQVLDNAQPMVNNLAGNDILLSPPKELPSNQNITYVDRIASDPQIVVVDSDSSLEVQEIKATTNMEMQSSEVFNRRQEIAVLAALDNVRNIHYERPGVITRSMSKCGSTGNLPDSTHQL